jgi:hypothetical protein
VCATTIAKYKFPDGPDSLLLAYFAAMRVIDGSSSKTKHAPVSI